MNPTSPASPAPRRVAVIGAGITGLTAAWRLQEQGCTVRLFEREAQPGGAIRTHHEQGYLIEAGPNSIQYGEPELKQLVRDLGLAAAVLPANAAAKRRFIVRGGRFEPVPMSPGAFLRTPLFGTRTKFAIFTELLTRPRVRPTDVNLAEFVRSHFTQELVDYAVNPLIAGIYAGDPEQLSVRHAFPSLWAAERTHGSLLRGMMAAGKARRARGEARGPAPIVSFPGGLQTLTDALAARLAPGVLQTGTIVETLLPGRPHRLVWRRGQETGAEEFDRIVLALPAHALARLTFGPFAERPFVSLESIVQPPVASLFLGYRREQIAHPLDGFGGLVPAIERREVLGILFSSTLFPGRAPDGRVGLTVFAGGLRQPGHGQLATPALLRQIDRDLRDLVGAQGEPEFVKHTVWPRAIPQYQLGYDCHLETMNRIEAAHPGLCIGGNVRHGISVPDCIKSGTQLAARAGADS